MNRSNKFLNPDYSSDSILDNSKCLTVSFIEKAIFPVESFIFKIGTDYMNLEEKYISLDESYRKMTEFMNNIESEITGKLNSRIEKLENENGYLKYNVLNSGKKYSM